MISGALDAATWSGVEALVDEYAGVSPRDQVAVLYTSDSYEPAAWVCAALELRGVPARRVWMAPLHDDGFAERLASALPSPEEVEGRLVVLSFERDTMSHSRELAAAVGTFDKDRRAVYRAISSSADLFNEALSVRPADLSALNATLLSRLMPATRLRITTPSGSDLRVRLDQKHRWISNRGSARAGGVAVLPAGEVATFPADISGTFIADYAFNVNAITDRDARLIDHPVTVRIREGRAIEYHCDDLEMAGFLDECLRTYCAYNVGELGFGTNSAIVGPIPMNSHINERRRGIHLGFGQHNQDPEVVGYQCPIHLDLIAAGGLVWVDDDPEPIDLESLAPSGAAHPADPRDEDVFSPSAEDLEVDDCCGILTSDGLRLFNPPPA